jgi:Ca2+-binding RTX toxin-like protein
VNRVAITDTANQIFIKDTAGIFNGVNDLPQCRYTVPAQTEVACAYPSPGFRLSDRVLRIALGDRNDTLNVDTSGPNSGWRQVTASDGPGRDMMVGWQGRDRFIAGPGNDRYYLRGGNDMLLANVPVPGVLGIPSGSGFDVAQGGFGNDLLMGGTDGDALFGGPGNDNLRGGAGIDFLYGGPGFDILDGRPGERRRG